MVIDQIYIGDDLLDLHKPINGMTLPPARHLFWAVPDRIHVMAALNYRLARFHDGKPPSSSAGTITHQEP